MPEGLSAGMHEDNRIKLENPQPGLMMIFEKGGPVHAAIVTAFTGLTPGETGCSTMIQKWVLNTPLTPG